MLAIELAEPVDTCHIPTPATSGRSSDRVRTSRHVPSSSSGQGQLTFIITGFLVSRPAGTGSPVASSLSWSTKRLASKPLPRQESPNVVVYILSQWLATMFSSSTGRYTGSITVGVSPYKAATCGASSRTKCSDALGNVYSVPFGLVRVSLVPSLIIPSLGSLGVLSVSPSFL